SCASSGSLKTRIRRRADRKAEVGRRKRVRSAPVFRLAPSASPNRAHSVVLSAALVLALVGVYRAPNRIGSSAREAPLARVAIEVDRPGALIPPDCDGL